MSHPAMATAVVEMKFDSAEPSTGWRLRTPRVGKNLWKSEADFGSPEKCPRPGGRGHFLYDGCGRIALGRDSVWIDREVDQVAVVPKLTANHFSAKDGVIPGAVAGCRFSSGVFQGHGQGLQLM